MAITAAQLDVKFTSSGAGKVTGELKSLGDAVKSAGSGFEGMYQKVNGFASQALNAVSRVSSGLGKIGLAGITAVFTKGTMAAWKQVDAVEQATLALRAYEKDATKVDKVLKDLLAFARSDEGKLFMREELFHAAQTMKVAGAETENLTRYVEIMSRSVNAGMGTWVDLERVIARVGSTGRLTGIEFELLQQMGFRLDSSLRNTTVTWEELFDILDKGSVQISGQSDTIRGKMISLQTAIRGVGVAFLGIDKDTSQFIEGGLGDRAVQGITAATEALKSLQPAAATAGSAFATILDGIEGLVGGFQMLPDSIQNIALGIVGAITAFGMFRQAIAAVTGAMRMMGLGAFTGLFSPLGLAITGVAIAGGLLIKSFLDQKQAAANFETSIKSLRQSLIDMRLDNLDAAADRLESFLDLTSKINDTLDQNRKNRLDLEWSWDGGKTREDLQAFIDTLSFSTEEMNRFTEAQNRIGQAFADPRIDGSRLLNDVTTLFTRLQFESGYTADQFLADFEAISNGLDKYGAKAEETADRVATAGHEAEQSWRFWQEGQGPFSPDFAPEVIEWEDFTKQVEDNIEAQKKAQEEQNEALRKAQIEWRVSALAVGGFDNALSQLNLSGAANDASLFAEQGVRIGQAFENTFRVLVTNVQQLGQGVQQASDWIEGLFAVNDEGFSQMDTLLNEGRISLEQYNAAWEAHGTILAANADIQQNLLAVQAMQAPYIAESVAATQAWVQELANMDAQTQRTTLAMMDMQTVQQTQDLVMLASADAFKSLGDEGRQMWEAMFMGAAQANPMLLETAEAFGYIKQTSTGIEFNWDAILSGGDALSKLTEEIGYLVDTLREVHNLPPIRPEVDTSGIDGAQDDVNNLRDIVRDPTGWRAQLEVDTSGTEDARIDLEAARATMIDLDGTSATVSVNVVNGSAAVGDGTGGAQNWSDFLGIPEEVNTLITATVAGAEDVQAVTDNINDIPDAKDPSVTITTTGLDDVTAAQTAIDGLQDKSVTVDIVIGTNELDTGLADWGIGTGGGGGGAAGYERKTVTIDVMADTSQAATDIAALMLLVNMTEVSTIRVDADVSAAQTKIDGLTGGGDEASKVTVMVDANVSQAQMKIDGLDGRFEAAPSVTVMVDADTSAATAAIDTLSTAAGGVPTTISVTATALTEGATAAIDTLSSAVTTLDGRTATVTAIGVDNASDEISTVSGALSALDGNTATVSINAIDNASDVIASVSSGLSSLDGRTATSYVNTVNTTTYRTMGSPVRAFASGGFVDTPYQIVGEHGPELVSLPLGSYVHTASETRAMRADENYGYGGGRAARATASGSATYQGDTIELHIHGNVYGIDDLADAMEGALSRRRRAFGVAA